MKLLALDTATDICGTALTEDSRLVADSRLKQKNVHNERLVVMIRDLVDCASWRLSDLEGIAITIGPGSFTGLRIGMSVAKGLAFSLDIPIVGVNTLDAMASDVDYWTGELYTMVKARADEVYFASYHKEREHLLKRSEDQIVHLKEIERLLTPGALVVCHPDNLRQRLSGLNVQVIPNRPSLAPYTVAKLGLQKFRENKTADLQAIEPLYLKNFEPKKKVYEWNAS